jgi:hypothetical protein
MNIIEAYIKFNKEMIIIISGLSGSGKTKMATNIEKLFKIKKIDVESFCINNNDKTIKLSDGTIVKDWDHIDSYDWTKINDAVNESKKNGVVISGPYFPQNKLKFSPNFHIHIKVSKQQIIENRRKYIIENPDKCEELVKLVNTPTEMLMINQITYPHYLKYLEESKIDKFINMKEITHDQSYDQAVDYLFKKIQDFLDEYNKNESVSDSSISNILDLPTNKKSLEKKSDSSTNSSDSDKIAKDTEFLLGTVEDEIGEMNYLV